MEFIRYFISAYIKNIIKYNMFEIIQFLEIAK